MADKGIAINRMRNILISSSFVAATVIAIAAMASAVVYLWHYSSNWKVQKIIIINILIQNQLKARIPTDGFLLKGRGKKK